MNSTPRAGAGFRVAHQICALAFLVPTLAAACDYPEDGTVGLNRVIASVRKLPETEAWQRERREAGEVVQFRLLLQKEAYFNRKCHWTVEVLAKGELWRRFYVSPDGKSVLIDYALQKEAAPPKATRPPEAIPGRP
jgi:hypothetical protein